MHFHWMQVMSVLCMAQFRAIWHFRKLQNRIESLCGWHTLKTENAGCCPVSKRTVKENQCLLSSPLPILYFLQPITESASWRQDPEAAAVPVCADEWTGFVTNWLGHPSCALLCCTHSSSFMLWACRQSAWVNQACQWTYSNAHLPAAVWARPFSACS